MRISDWSSDVCSSDLVICGFGRLGEWFGFQHFGFKPDLVSMAKGLSSGYLPISAVGVADHIVEVLRSVGDDFVHGFTYSGHPTRSEERRVGKGWVSTCRSRGSP